MESAELPVDAGSPTGYHPQTVPLCENRLSIPFFIRFSAATAGAFLTGAALGISHGGRTAGMRFRAENSHRFPTTSAGWYLYHKSKNYHMMLGGIKEGLKMGSKIGFWAGGFFIVEEAVDEWRGTKDFLSTVVAGMTIAAGFSAQPWSVCPVNPLTEELDTMLTNRTRHLAPQYRSPHHSDGVVWQPDVWAGARCSRPRKR